MRTYHMDVKLIFYGGKIENAYMSRFLKERILQSCRCNIAIPHRKFWAMHRPSLMVNAYVHRIPCNLCTRFHFPSQFVHRYARSIRRAVCSHCMIITIISLIRFAVHLNKWNRRGSRAMSVPDFILRGHYGRHSDSTDSERYMYINESSVSLW